MQPKLPWKIFPGDIFSEIFHIPHFMLAQWHRSLQYSSDLILRLLELIHMCIICICLLLIIQSNLYYAGHTIALYIYVFLILKPLCNVHFLLYPSLSWLLLLCVNKFSYTSSCFPPLSWNKVKSQIIVSFPLCLWSKIDQTSIVSSIPFRQQYIHIGCNIRRKVVLNTWRKSFPSLNLSSHYSHCVSD